MPFHIRDEETDALVRELARKRNTSLTEAVKVAVRHELRREEDEIPLRDRLRRIADSLAEYRDTGEPIDKAFFDELSGD